ncbi:MAG: hypothetical protein MUC88_27425 [Planctomycetes bacterium]|jgi:hypothetical protein|nr:hypothetical protein [Planctomycetota bacterium]
MIDWQPWLPTALANLARARELLENLGPATRARWGPVIASDIRNALAAVVTSAERLRRMILDVEETRAGALPDRATAAALLAELPAPSLVADADAYRLCVTYWLAGLPAAETGLLISYFHCAADSLAYFVTIYAYDRAGS